MKRITTLVILILSFALFIILPVNAAEFELVGNWAGLLTDQESLELNELAMDISEEYQCEVSIAMMEYIEDDDVAEFANLFYEEYDYGYGADNSGLMLMLVMDSRDYALIAHGDGNTAFTDHGKDVLLEKHLLPLLAEDKYYDAFLIYLNKTAEFLQMAENGTPFDVETDEENAQTSIWVKLAIVILIPLLIAGIVCLIWMRKMKTAVSERAARNYMSDGGLQLTKETDTFLNKTETRTRIEKKPPGGGTSIGSGGSSSAKGKF
ncbi:MAG TPA: TPM domain-containing protein [Syntrophomonadaceae bacterium]|nr:TPM domain-containing protein [Syntrophomonadaceae bacterium]